MKTDSIRTILAVGGLALIFIVPYFYAQNPTSMIPAIVLLGYFFPTFFLFSRKEERAFMLAVLFIASIAETLNVSVADTGTGIPKDELKNIFKPFYTTKQKSGTGLGLYIVKTLVEQNGGKINVESCAGQGAMFRLKFPV